MQRRSLILPVLLMLLLGCASCARRPATIPATLDAPPVGSGPVSPVVSAVVSIEPQGYFVERVGGDRVSVEVLVHSGQEPHTFEPTPATMVALSKGDVYFTIGLPFERTLVDKLRSAAPKLQLVDTRQGIELRPVDSPQAGQGHGDMDPHIWLAPKLVKLQARTIRDTLAKLDPGGASEYGANLRRFEHELAELDRGIARALAPLKGREFLVFHPSFGYFADAYGLRQVCIETEGKEPGPRRLAEIIAEARRSDVKAIFVEPQFSSKSAEAIAREIGAQVVALDPLARDWLPNMQRMTERIRLGLTGSVQ